jgi:hypothetical protein
LPLRKYHSTLTAWSIPPWECNILSANKEFPTPYEIWGFVPVLRTAF